jgi:hypothetical protein
MKDGVGHVEAGERRCEKEGREGAAARFGIEGSLRQDGTGRQRAQSLKL